MSDRGSAPVSITVAGFEIVVSAGASAPVASGEEVAGGVQIAIKVPRGGDTGPTAQGGMPGGGDTGPTMTITIRVDRLP